PLHRRLEARVVDVDVAVRRPRGRLELRGVGAGRVGHRLRCVRHTASPDQEPMDERGWDITRRWSSYAVRGGTVNQPGSAVVSSMSFPTRLQSAWTPSPPSASSRLPP